MSTTLVVHLHRDVVEVMALEDGRLVRAGTLTAPLGVVDPEALKAVLRPVVFHGVDIAGISLQPRWKWWLQPAFSVRSVRRITRAQLAGTPVLVIRPLLRGGATRLAVSRLERRLARLNLAQSRAEQNAGSETGIG